MDNTGKQEIVSRKTLASQQTEGISLIALIITIIVIIILAAIVIFSGLNTPDRANLARFMQEISDFRTAVQQDFMQKKAKYAVEGKSRSDSQIYNIIAKGEDIDMNEPTEPVDTIDNVGLELKPESLSGKEFYLIAKDTNVANWQKQSQYYAPTEKHYVTDEGETFVLPGYRVEQGDTIRWYVNERKYYESEEPIVYTALTAVGFHIGDIVNYTAISHSYSTNKENTGADTSVSLSTDDNLTWRILAIEDSGIKITPGVVNANQVELKGKKAYFRGAEELHTICRELYSNNTLGLYAKNLTAEEINKVTGFKVKDWAEHYTQAKNAVYYLAGTSLSQTVGHTETGDSNKIIKEGSETASSITVIEDGIEYTYAKAAHDGNSYNFYIGNDALVYGGVPNLSAIGGYSAIKPDKQIIDNVTTHYPVFCKGMNYSYNPSEAVPELLEVLGSSDNKGWLASPIITTSTAPSARAGYAMRRADGVTMGNKAFATSFGDDLPDQRINGVIPVITLTSTHLTKKGVNDESGAIRGTVENPWEVK